MKCPHCNAASDVIATRNAKGVDMRRTRLCHNLHRFFTLETPAPPPVHGGDRRSQSFKAPHA